jgi:hypothetical protein
VVQAEPVAEELSLAMLDGRSPDGIAGFYWLPPLGPSSDAFPGVFDAELAPTIEVCLWVSRACQAVVARLTVQGTSDGRIVADAAKQLYRAAWLVSPADRDPTKRFRIQVILDGRIVGYADIQGSTRPDVLIRFRAETVLRIAGTVGPAGGTVVTPDDAVRLDIPAGALAHPTDISISRTTDPLAPGFYGTWQFGPSPMIFAAPVQLSLAVDPALFAAEVPGASPFIVTLENPTDTAWTVAGGFNYDASTGRVTASITHFSKYGIVLLYPSDVDCGRIIPPISIVLTPLDRCSTPPSGEFRDTVTVTQGNSILTNYFARIFGTRKGGFPVLAGWVAACENTAAIPFPPWNHCWDELTSTTLDAAIATRGPTGFVSGNGVGRTELLPTIASVPKGSTLVLVSGGTRLFSFANGANADVGGGVGTLFGGAVTSGGKLVLNGATAYAELNQRLVGSTGSLTMAFFAREAVTQSGWVEFVSQGQSGAGFYVGRDPSGIIRVSDFWISTGVPMPADNLEHHYAVTFDDVTATSRLYVDGQLAATRSGPLATGTGPGNNTRFGRQFDPFAEFLNGTLDDLIVLPAALSAGDVQAIARRSSDLACSAEGSLFSGNGPGTWLVFENQASEPVHVDWLDFLGRRVRYNTALPVGGTSLLGTFITHPWIITGASSGTCYGIWMPTPSGRIVRVQ